MSRPLSDDEKAEIVRGMAQSYTVRFARTPHTDDEKHGVLDSLLAFLRAFPDVTGRFITVNKSPRDCPALAELRQCAEEIFACAFWLGYTINTLDELVENSVELYGRYALNTTEEIKIGFVAKDVMGRQIFVGLTFNECNQQCPEFWNYFTHPDRSVLNYNTWDGPTEPRFEPLTILYH